MEKPIAKEQGGIHWRVLALLATFYLFFAAFYMVILKFQEPNFLGNDPTYNWQTLYLDYPLKALFTLPVWYLIFRLGRQWSLLFKILLSIALLPLWTKGWQQTYYYLIDNVLSQIVTGEEGNQILTRLSGNGEWFDIYVPSLFYCIQFGAFFAYEYHRRVRVAERARAESDRLALTSELSALKAQLNPHFLYNAFNAISASVPAEQEETRELVARLSDMFRYQLRATREEVLPLGEELDFVEDYLTLEKARFGDRLRVDIQVAKKERGVMVPPLLLQPLVENAVRHGISPKVDGGRILILAESRGDRLTLRVEDDGVGLDEKKLANARGFGLRNTRRRLELLPNHNMTIHCPAGGGTVLEIELPRYETTENRPDRRRSPRPAVAS